MSPLIRTVVFYQALIVAGTLIAGCSSTKVDTTLSKIGDGLDIGEKLVEITKDQYVNFCELAPTSKLCADQTKARLVDALEHGPMLAGQIEALANEVSEVVVELAPEDESSSDATSMTSNSEG